MSADVDDYDDELAPRLRNHGEVEASRFQPETLRAMLALKQALLLEPGLTGVQISVNDTRNPDEPPKLHAICDPDPSQDWPGYWFAPKPHGKQSRGQQEEKK